MKINFKNIFKKRSPVFYIFLAWVISTVFILYFVFPLISANFGYFVNQKKNDDIKTVTNPKAQTAITKEEKVLENKLVISKINVDAPIVEAESIKDKDIVKSMESGVVHYPTTSKPGEKGNVFLTGHSSNYRWAKGSYNFVFALLNKMQKNDLIIVYFNGTKYVYKVFDIVVVSPQDVSVLGQTEDSIISLMTCDPPGTTWKRRVVKGIQIEPDSKNNATPGGEKEGTINNLIGN